MKFLFPLPARWRLSARDYSWIEGDELRAKLGSPHFTAAVYTPGCVLMNPAALTRGLADNMPGNVTIHEHSPVIDIRYENGIRVRTPKGEVYAPKMILAVNGFAQRFGFFKSKLLPFVAHASLSRPLNKAEQASYGAPEDWGLTPANAFVGVTMRYTSDKRILIRHGIHYQPSLRFSDAERRQVAVTHKKLFDERFPMLPDVTMEHTWSGFICLSQNGAPGFGKIAPNVYSAVCQNAVGVTKGTMSGMLAADMACGEDNPLIADMETLGAPSRLPPRPFLDIGVRARQAWDLWRFKHEA